MTLEIESRSFRGVECLHCKNPIPVPAIVGGTDSVPQEGQESLLEHSSVFALRCPTCHKEKPYRTREIVDFEGTPEVNIPQLWPTSDALVQDR